MIQLAELSNLFVGARLLSTELDIDGFRRVKEPVRDTMSYLVARETENHKVAVFVFLVQSFKSYTSLLHRVR